MTPVRLTDLPQLITHEGWKGPRPFLRCVKCGERRSANRGDYFRVDPDAVIQCVDCVIKDGVRVPMELVTERIVFVPWPEDKETDNNDDD